MLRAPDISGPEGDALERAELATLLASDLFLRAPNLSRVLAYLCEQCFRGEAGQIKEYNIAVEALGRPASFDPQEDAIVRVDIYHLRKRLQQYYAREGADHPIRIVLPPGKYAPEFVRVEQAALVPPELETPSEPDPPADPAPPLPPRHWKRVSRVALTVVTLVTVAVAVVAAVLWPRPARVASPPQSAQARPLPSAPAPVSPDGAIRILCGSNTKEYVDNIGRVWHGDRFFDGGEAGKRTGVRILRTQEPKVFESWRSGAFDYHIPLARGTYELRLYFAEMTFGEGNPEGGGEAYRLMNVLINRKDLLRQYDLIADIGAPNTAAVKVFKDVGPDWDGVLHLRFSAFTGKAFINAIEILPSTPGKMRPVRISTREQAYTDKQGRLWDADHYYLGGRRNSVRLGPVAHPDAELYATQRYGNFTYAIPVPAPGKYRLTLHFTENWLGPSNAGGGGKGDRVFDVFCNGVALLRDFDIFREAGGENRPLEKVFHNIPASPQGRLVVSFVPVLNYACLTAIEVADESATR